MLLEGRIAKSPKGKPLFQLFLVSMQLLVSILNQRTIFTYDKSSIFVVFRQLTFVLIFLPVWCELRSAA